LKLLKALVDHHNKTSLYFSSFYPLKSFGQVISEMFQKIKDGYATVDIFRVDGKIIAFSQYSVEQNIGKLEFFAVLNGYSGLLIEKALKYFERNQLKNRVKNSIRK
jgi:hypothetical protein